MKENKKNWLDLLNHAVEMERRVKQAQMDADRAIAEAAEVNEISKLASALGLSRPTVYKRIARVQPVEGDPEQTA